MATDEASDEVVENPVASEGDADTADRTSALKRTMSGTGIPNYTGAAHVPLLCD
jgi:hypothetical protein